MRTSLVCVVSSRASFFITDLSRSEERRDRTFGFWGFCLNVSLSPRLWYVFGPGMSFSRPMDPIPTQREEVLEASMAATPTGSRIFYMSSNWVRDCSFFSERERCKGLTDVQQHHRCLSLSFLFR